MPRNQWDIITKATKEAVEKAVRRTALDLTSGLIEKTPVDTGWARANWIPSVGTPAEGTDGPRVRGSISTGKQQQGLAEAAQFQLTDLTVFISNSVPYISKLNGGSSAQAPALFVEQQVAETVNKINSRS